MTAPSDAWGAGAYAPSIVHAGPACRVSCDGPGAFVRLAARPGSRMMSGRKPHKIKAPNRLMSVIETRLLTTRRAILAFRDTPGRHGRLVQAADCDELLVAGDLHGHV